jgi:hypothetical protein
MPPEAGAPLAPLGTAVSGCSPHLMGRSCNRGLIANAGSGSRCSAHGHQREPSGGLMPLLNAGCSRVSESGYFGRLKRASSERAVQRAGMPWCDWKAEMEAEQTRQHRDRQVNRAFARNGPNPVWVTDITQHPTRGRQGLLLLRAGHLRYARRGRRLVDRRLAPRRLGDHALGMAIDSRLGNTTTAGTVIHSDQASSSGPGPSPLVRKLPDWCPRWAASATATTTR